MSCDLKRILRQGLCPNDLNIQVQIEKRTLKPTAIGTTETTVAFESLGNLMAGVETVNPVSRQFMKGIEDSVTHLFYFQYSSRIAKLERNTSYIKMRGERYRIKGILNINENNRILVFYCEFRGSEDESKA